MYFPLPGMLTRKPGDDPSPFPLSTTHVPSATDSGSRNCDGSQADRLPSGSPGAAFPTRFTNQDESGTSSRLLTSTASPPGSNAKASDSGRKTRLSTPSQTSVES